MTSSTASPPTRSLLVRLTREWEALTSRPAVLRRAAAWDLGVAFESLDDLVAATGFRSDRTATAVNDASESNAVLGRLLLVARRDDVAARVVLQRMLPGIVTASRRWARRCQGADPVAELLAAAWPVIRTYPVERRPQHLAAQLLRDTEYHAFIRPRRRAIQQDLVPPTTFDRDLFGTDPERRPVDSRVELAELVAVARRTVLTDRDLRLLGLLLSGRSTPEVAAAMATSVRSVGNHRDALVSRLRQTARVLEAA
jgi:DNA-binding CsgD family transcriptional regulator